jgi:hypothetical protein
LTRFLKQAEPVSSVHPGRGNPTVKIAART